MSNSLQDQLLKAGLVTEQQLEQARQPVKKPQKGPRRDKRAASKGAASKGPASKGPASKGPASKGAARDGRRRGEGDPARRGHAAQAPDPRPAAPRPLDKRTRRRLVRALIEGRKLNTDQGEEPYNFLHGKRIKRLYVTAELRDRLLAGELAIASVYGLHYILEADAVQALNELLPDTFVHRHDATASVPVDAEAAEYTGYEVPDDLIW